MTVDTADPGGPPSTTSTWRPRRAWMLDALMAVYDYARNPGFQAVLAELNALADAGGEGPLRPQGAAVAGGTRTARHHPARRPWWSSAPGSPTVAPTVFCIVKHLPDPTRKMTLTFDQGQDALAHRVLTGSARTGGRRSHAPPPPRAYRAHRRYPAAARATGREKEGSS